MSHGDREQTSNSKKKNTALNTLLGGVSQTGMKGTEVLPRQPHPPVMMGDQPGEGKRRGQKSSHTQSHNLDLPLPLRLRKKRKGKKKHHG